MIIGFAGYAGSGKDAAADLLATSVEPEFHPGFDDVDGEYSFHKYALADPIKKAASEMFGIDISYFYDSIQKNEIIEDWGLSPRHIAQKLGTEGGRDLFRKDIWVKRMEMEYKNEVINGPHDYMLITDVRFPNEVEKIHEQGGYVIRIDRRNIMPVNPHESEQWINKLLVDDVVDNNGNLNNLRTKMISVFTKIEQLRNQKEVEV